MASWALALRAVGQAVDKLIDRDTANLSQDNNPCRVAQAVNTTPNNDRFVSFRNKVGLKYNFTRKKCSQL
jgi:hypothetical protein